MSSSHCFCNSLNPGLAVEAHVCSYCSLIPRVHVILRACKFCFREPVQLGARVRSSPVDRTDGLACSRDLGQCIRHAEDRSVFYKVTNPDYPHLTPFLTLGLSRKDSALLLFPAKSLVRGSPLP